MVDVATLTKEQLCRMFDHTNLKAFADDAMMKKLCDEAKDLHTAMVAINSVQVARCKKYLAGTDIHVGSAVAFPLGQMTIDAKVFEAEDAIKNGADEIDYIINITEVKEKNYDYIRNEMQRMKVVCKTYGVVLKVILEICYLTDEEIVKVCEIAKEIKPDYVKTSTGWGTGGATVEGVRLMKSVVGDEVKVKAAGGIRDWPTCKAMLEAGAERIGTSSSYAILKGFLEERGEKR